MNSISTSERAASQISEDIPITAANAGQINNDDDDEDSSENLEDTTGLDNSDETLRAQMFEFYAQAHDQPPDGASSQPNEDELDSSPLGRGLFNMFNQLEELPEDVQKCFTRIKKDIFNSFHMIPLSSSHGLRAVFRRTLRDHMMRWDPVIRNVLVYAIQHVYNVFGNVRGAESGQPPFSKTAWQKANAVLELAREGYLSDLVGVTLHEKAGVDEHGLEKYNCRRGTNKVESGLHDAIYRKLGAPHAAPRPTVNSLTDHRTHFNPQATAKHLFGVDWEYYHDLALINRTSFLLNYLSDIIDGADSYADWMDRMPTYMSVQRRDLERFKLNINNYWLRRRQGIALPILPPTAPEARKYFFSTIGRFVADASAKGNCKINYVDFAEAWNQTADGKTRCYVTSDVLAAYAKTWDKTNNARASQELIDAKMDLVTQTRELFQAHTAPFPDSLIGFASSSHPQRGVIDFTDSDDHALPSSITVDLAISHPRIMPNPPAEGHGPYAQRNRQPKEPCSSSASAVAQNSCEAVRTRGSTKVDSGDPYISPAGSGPDFEGQNSSATHIENNDSSTALTVIHSEEKKDGRRTPSSPRYFLGPEKRDSTRSCWRNPWLYNHTAIWRSGCCEAQEQDEKAAARRGSCRCITARGCEARAASCGDAGKDKGEGDSAFGGRTHRGTHIGRLRREQIGSRALTTAQVYSLHPLPGAVIAAIAGHLHHAPYTVLIGTTCPSLCVLLESAERRLHCREPARLPIGLARSKGRGRGEERTLPPPHEGVFIVAGVETYIWWSFIVLLATAGYNQYNNLAERECTFAVLSFPYAKTKCVVPCLFPTSRRAGAHDHFRAGLSSSNFNGSLTDSFNNSLGYLASILTPNLLHGFPAACRNLGVFKTTPYQRVTGVLVASRRCQERDTRRESLVKSHDQNKEGNGEEMGMEGTRYERRGGRQRSAGQAQSGRLLPEKYNISFTPPSWRGHVIYFVSTELQREVG
ncbi:hypothetical protein B0H13DRAFT_1897403 [Mycena leptocephala]|nr:hypothetical protein B0H13DRAFT_1897403 [Mycena leptocephala]